MAPYHHTKLPNNLSESQHNVLHWFGTKDGIKERMASCVLLMVPYCAEFRKKLSNGSQDSGCLETLEKGTGSVQS